jgi:hypothetical protein
MVSSSRADAQRTQHLLHSTLVLSHYLRGYRPVKSERRFCVSGHLWLEAHRRLGRLAAILFRWRDSAHHNEQKLLTVSLDEFLRRFLLHVLPKGFVRFRHFGFLADRCRLRSNGVLVNWDWPE